MKTKLISILLLGAVLSSCSSTQDQNSPAPVKEKAVSKKDPVKVIKADIIDYSYQIDSGSNSSDGVIMLGIQSFKLESNNIKRVALRFFENRDQDSVVVKEETLNVFLPSRRFNNYLNALAVKEKKKKFILAILPEEAAISIVGE